jgi:uncharacterized membrane protein required for colicin V production
MDALLVGFVGGFIYGGWRTGFLRRLLGLAFAAISIVVAAYFRYAVGAIATTFFKGIPTEYANLVGFTIAFPAILASLHLASRKLIGKVNVSGLTKEADSALGAVFGALEAVVILSAAIVVFDVYFKTSGTLVGASGAGMLAQVRDAMDASTTVRILRGTTVPAAVAILGPVLPKDLASVISGAMPSGLPGGSPGGLPSFAP